MKDATCLITRKNTLPAMARATIAPGIRSQSRLVKSNIAEPLFGRLQPRRCEPFAYSRAGLSLACPSEGRITYRSMGEKFSLFTKASGFLGEAFLEGHSLLKSATFLLHGAVSPRVLRPSSLRYPRF